MYSRICNFLVDRGCNMYVADAIVVCAAIFLFIVSSGFVLMSFIKTMSYLFSESIILFLIFSLVLSVCIIVWVISGVLMIEWWEEIE